MSAIKSSLNSAGRGIWFRRSRKKAHPILILKQIVERRNGLLKNAATAGISPPTGRRWLAGGDFVGYFIFNLEQSVIKERGAVKCIFLRLILLPVWIGSNSIHYSPWKPENSPWHCHDVVRWYHICQVAVAGSSRVLRRRWILNKKMADRSSVP